MKLEVGKKYTVRSPEDSYVQFVTVLVIEGFKSSGGHTVLAVATRPDGTNAAYYYHANGLGMKGELLSTDIVGEYREPINTHFYAVPNGSVVNLQDLYLSRAAAEGEAGGRRVIKLKVEEVLE